MLLDGVIDGPWLVWAVPLVLLMQAGFLCLETGLTRHKNSINVAVKNVADFVIAVMAFWLIGFTLMFGASWEGWFGLNPGWPDLTADETLASFFLFQAAFCGAAATIVSGAIAERATFMGYLLTTIGVSAILYPVFGHWAWGGIIPGTGEGWLAQLGFVDFAGGSVVHSVGGWFALASALMVGPRLNRFDEQGRPRRISPSNLPMTFLGVLLLMCGWFGFNCGSTLTSSANIGTVGLTTVIAACSGSVVTMGLSWALDEDRLPAPMSLGEGMLGGLVGVTASAAYITTTSAAVIGAIAGAIVYFGGRLLINVLHVDDVVGSTPVHAFCGLWGTLAVALFASHDVIGPSRWESFLVQSLGAGCAFLWAFGGGLALCRLIQFVTPLRVSEEEERVGLNIAEHGATSSLLELAQAMDSVSRNGAACDAQELEIDRGTEIGELAGFFNKMIRAVQDQRERADRQARAFEVAMRENVNELAGQTTRVSEAVAAIEERTGAMTAGAQSLTDELERTFRHLQETSVSIGAKEERTIQRVGGIVESIDHLTFQTRVLSLNASIEAARAGDAGVSFAVVAESVRKLSDDTNNTAKSIEQELQSMRDASEAMRGGVRTGIESTQDLLEQFRAYTEAVDQVSQQVEQVRDSMSKIVQAAQGAAQRLNA